MGQQLQNGACASMNQQLTQNANQILGASCATLAQRVQKQQPSAECAPCLLSLTIMPCASNLLLPPLLRCSVAAMRL